MNQIMSPMCPLFFYPPTCIQKNGSLSTVSRRRSLIHSATSHELSAPVRDHRHLTDDRRALYTFRGLHHQWSSPWGVIEGKLKIKLVKGDLSLLATWREGTCRLEMTPNTLRTVAIREDQMAMNFIFKAPLNVSL